MSAKQVSWNTGFYEECVRQGVDPVALLKQGQMAGSLWRGTGRDTGSLGPLTPWQEFAAQKNKAKLRQLSKPQPAAIPTSPVAGPLPNLSSPTNSPRLNPAPGLSTSFKQDQLAPKPQSISTPTIPTPVIPKPVMPTSTQVATSPTPVAPGTPFNKLPTTAQNLVAPSLSQPSPSSAGPTTANSALRFANTPPVAQTAPAAAPLPAPDVLAAQPAPVTKDNAPFGWLDSQNRAITQQERNIIDARKQVQSRADQYANSQYSPAVVNDWKNKAWTAAGRGEAIPEFKETPSISGVVRRPDGTLARVTPQNARSFEQGGGFQGGSEVSPEIAAKLYNAPEPVAASTQVAQAPEPEFDTRSVPANPRSRGERRLDSEGLNWAQTSRRQVEDSMARNVARRNELTQPNTQLARSLPALPAKQSEYQEKWAEGFDEACDLYKLDAVELLKYANSNDIGNDDFARGFKRYCALNHVNPNELYKVAFGLKDFGKEVLDYAKWELGFKGLAKAAPAAYKALGMARLLPYLARLGWVGAAGAGGYVAGRGLNALSGGAIDRVGAKAWAPITDWWENRKPGSLPKLTKKSDFIEKDAHPLAKALALARSALSRKGIKAGAKASGIALLGGASWAGVNQAANQILAGGAESGADILPDMSGYTDEPIGLKDLAKYVWYTMSPSQQQAALATAGGTLAGGIVGTGYGAVKKPVRSKGETVGNNARKMGLRGSLAGGLAGLVGSSGLSMLNQGTPS